tara:strand:+ start:57 stop:251 length:195 start_codon:yes stop_codon:yes gene_type:complete
MKIHSTNVFHANLRGAGSLIIANYVAATKTVGQLFKWQRCHKKSGFTNERASFSEARTRKFILA